MSQALLRQKNKSDSYGLRTKRIPHHARFIDCANLRRRPTNASPTNPAQLILLHIAVFSD